MKFSKVQVDNKTLRKSKNKVRKLISILFPLSLACAVVSAIFIYSLVTALQRPAYISPLSTLGIQAIRSTEDTNRSELEQVLKEKKIAYTKVVRGENSSHIIYFDNERKAIIADDKNIKSQISSLQFILSRLTMEGRQFKSLDLRFDKPIIIFEK